MEPIASDLAPGDTWAAAMDWTGLRIERIRSTRDPRFDALYTRLWAEFGERGEMEQRDVIAERFTWGAQQAGSPYAFLYEMLAVLRAQELIGMRDHTAIVAMPCAGSAQPVSIVVHLSHALVLPTARGHGLGGWLRALPLQTARACAERMGIPAGAHPITLVAEMEHLDPANDATARRRRSYGRAGFLEIDPGFVGYAQPDFRSRAAIDASAVRPVPLALVVRRVGREDERSMPGAEVRAIVDALYAMYEATMPPAHMASLRAAAEQRRQADAIVALTPLEPRLE
ncbi:MAG: hypothetical protein AB7N53_00720 [Candidatus Binatia bacterium]